MINVYNVQILIFIGIFKLAITYYYASSYKIAVPMELHCLIRTSSFLSLSLSLSLYIYIYIYIYVCVEEWLEPPPTGLTGLKTI